MSETPNEDSLELTADDHPDAEGDVTSPEVPDAEHLEAVAEMDGEPV